MFTLISGGGAFGHAAANAVDDHVFCMDCDVVNVVADELYLTPCVLVVLILLFVVHVHGVIV